MTVSLLKIDEQHARLDKLLQRLKDSRDVSPHSEVIAETLDELTSLAAEHFRDEEKLLEAHGYPDLKHHKAEHKAYRLRVVSFCCDVMDDKESVSKELLEFIQKWWVDHHEGADQRADEFLRKLNKKS